MTTKYYKNQLQSCGTSVLENIVYLLSITNDKSDDERAELRAARAILRERRVNNCINF